MITTAQVTTFRELVLAHHAFERSLSEFAKAAGVTATRDVRTTLASICQEIEPREVSADDAATAIHYLKELE